MRRRPLTVLTTALLLASGVVVATADAKIPPQWKNCTVVNHRYPHGIGKYGARDKTSGDPVTNFKHSNALYALAMKWNRGLDRDRDGIACEQV